MTHSCQLCERLAAGFTTTRNGVEISPYCPDCDAHHFADYPCLGNAPLPRSTCPRCRVNRRAVVDIPQSGRWEHKTYGAMCHQCYMVEGWHQITHTVHVAGKGDYEATWYEKPPQPDDMSIEELFERMGA